MSGRTNAREKNGALKDIRVARMYDYLTEHGAEGDGWTVIAYAPLARLSGLPWRFAGHDNAQTIVVLRHALYRLELLGLIRVKSDTHTTVTVQVRKSLDMLQVFAMLEGMPKTKQERRGLWAHN